MKLNDYFLEAKKISLNENQKAQIFEKIHSEIASSASTTSYLKMLKYIAIGSWAVLAVFAFVPIFNQPTNIQLKNWLISSLWGSSIVKANPVWEIVNLTWNIFINGVESTETKIYENQNLYLGSGKIEFSIWSWSKWVIIWPATFAIHKTDNSYEIEIISGSYVQVIEKNISSENVSVKTNQVYISKTDNTKPFWVTLTNQSWDIQIISQDQNLDIKTSDWEKFVLNAASTVKLASKDIEEKIAFNQSSISSEIISGNSNSSIYITIKEDISKISYTSNRSYSNSSQNFSSLENEKSKIIEDIVYPSFLKEDLKQYKASYENWDESANIIAYQNIASRMNRIYEKLDINYKIDPTNINVWEISQNLQKELKTFDTYTSWYQNQSTKNFVRDLNLITVRKFWYKSTKKPTNSSSSYSSINSSTNSQTSSSSSNISSASTSFSSQTSSSSEIKPSKIENISRSAISQTSITGQNTTSSISSKKNIENYSSSESIISSSQDNDWNWEKKS